ncbi:PAM68 family protein [Nostoc sp. FACHB-87]|uniref:PAM68 family protein n=1 Tax=Nostocaceae TaxID=1162 RepID=UPI001684E090|nr:MULTISPECIES: PAM68 family protein [Nostocaceae]MBD2301152.1 PAM68 family protein [Nostoc sp. FACHB-190]MBD2456966.1 PAM68 family protein [Nostoc sp. FACHB-87]MBD2479979.1 PAM68 family protein [Anabaena sp. FACHB-83]
MSAEESERSRLPFEPNKKRQKPVKVQKNPIKSNISTESASQKPPLTKEEMAIPKVVSQRMIRRVAFFCGVPTALGITTLVVSYLLATQAQIKIAPVAVLLVNMGLFGLGVLGITYGVLSASWDEERPGGLLGISEFSTNFGRMVAVWRETRQKNL